MEVRVMSRDMDWAVFEKAVEITVSAVRGAMGGENCQPPKYAGEVFTEVYTALRSAAEQLPERAKTGF
ncbi:MAG: hypothetical protein ACXWXP_04010 [Actinomycetota bacterium]